MRKINYQSDFDFILTIRDKEGNDVGFPQWDWKAVLYTVDKKEGVRISSIGGAVSGCYNDNGRIHVVCDDHGLQPGKLSVDLTVLNNDAQYPDGKRKEVYFFATDIELSSAKECSPLKLGDTIEGIGLDLGNVENRIVYIGKDVAKLSDEVKEHSAEIQNIKADVAGLAHNEGGFHVAENGDGFNYRIHAQDAFIREDIYNSGLEEMRNDIESLQDQILELKFNLQQTDERLASTDEQYEQKLRTGLAEIGYTEAEIEECLEDVPNLNLTHIKIAKEIKSKWTGTNITYAFRNREDIVIMPQLDYSKITNMRNYWKNCHSLSYLPHIDAPEAIYFDWVFYNDSGAKFENRLKRCPRINAPKLKYFSNYIPDSRFPLTGFPTETIDLRNVVQCGVYGYFKPETPMPQVLLTPSKITSLVNFAGNSYITDSIVRDTFKDEFPVCTNINTAFFRCERLEDLSEVEIIAPKCTIAGNLFRESPGLRKLPKRLKFADGCNMAYSFMRLFEIEEIPDYTEFAPAHLVEIINGEDTTQYGVPITKLKAIRGFDLRLAQSLSFGFGCNQFNYPYLSYVRFLNLGMSNLDEYNFEFISHWGEDAEGLQSLVDTLLTNSHDRAAAGMPVATIVLEQAVYNRLSEEQRKAIEAKGYAFRVLKNLEVPDNYL